MDKVIIEENGDWFPQQEYGFINNFLPNVLVYARCNHDGKLLTNGDATMKVAWYITKYATKHQQRNSNASALLYNGLAYHFKDEKFVNDIQEHTWLLLFRAHLSVNRHSEQSAPQVISYLMGWGNSLFSHQYVPLYWSSMVAYLKHMCPELRERYTSILDSKKKLITIVYRKHLPGTMIDEIVRSSEEDRLQHSPQSVGTQSYEEKKKLVELKKIIYRKMTSLSH